MTFLLIVIFVHCANGGPHKMASTMLHPCPSLLCLFFLERNRNFKNCSYVPQSDQAASQNSQDWWQKRDWVLQQEVCISEQMTRPSFPPLRNCPLCSFRVKTAMESVWQLSKKLMDWAGYIHKLPSIVGAYICRTILSLSSPFMCKGLMKSI